MPDLPDLANLDYVDRVNRAIDHVTRDLAEPLSLDEVARVACFSPHHFHRIFKSLVGETLHAFVKRVRLERALFLMAHEPDVSLTDVALRCGFSSSSDFSRSFRAQYGVPPSAFDLDTFRRTNRKALHLERLPPGENPDNFAVTLRRLPERRVAYMRVHEPYKGGVPAVCERFLVWARERGLAGNQWLGYQWEDPEIVPLEQCRYDVGLVIAADTAVDQQVSVTTFPPMTVAELALAGPIELEMRAIDWMYTTWLPRSGYVPDHQPAFEVWRGEPFAHGLTHFELAMHLPVVRQNEPR